MTRFSLAFKVGILMTLALALVTIAGYLTFTSLSSIVASIDVKSRPDLRLLTIRDIASDLDKAESSVRMYRLSQNQHDIRPYYKVIAEIDGKIDSLRITGNNDTVLLAQIDTISQLIEQNMLVWNEMIDLYHTDSLDAYIRTLTAKIAVGTLNKKVSERSILKRVFSRKAIKAEEQQQEALAQQEIISDLNRIEKHDSIKNSLLLDTETKLAANGEEIRDRLYMLIARMENDVIQSIKRNSKTADQLAHKTYQWLAVFAFLGTLLVILVMLVVARFVRKTREYQKALEFSKEETEKLAKTKELFMANMSHEIRTPVNAIHGFAEQLGHQSLNEKSRTMLGIIKSTSAHLMQVVNDILDFSKLQNAKIELEKAHFELPPLFEELKLLFTENAAAKNTQIHYNISNATPKVLFGDVHRLKQIMLNLIGNAVKFTNNGMVEFSADVHSISGNTFLLIIKVRDTGIGISKEMQLRVFDDFAQAEVGTSRVYGGTGLGLSIVKKLVELHHGTVELKSEKGKGTEITCSLPYEQGNPNNITRIAERLIIPESIRHKRILIVDDEAYNRMLFKTIFSRWKVLFDEAENGFEAIQKIKTTHYDMVFMDARMPGLDGLETVDQIRKNLGISKDQLPVVGTSATHATEDIRMYELSGMNGFLPKPFTEKMLLNVMLSYSKTSSTDFKKGYNNKGVHEAAVQSDKIGEKATDQPFKVNLNNLYHLTNNDVSFVKQLLYSFIETTEQGLQELQDAIVSNDMASVREITHKISSPCRHLGADNLYTRLKRMEEAVIQENISILSTLSQESLHEFHEIKVDLLKHIETI